MPKTKANTGVRSKKPKSSSKDKRRPKKQNDLKTRSFLLGDTERKWLSYQTNQTHAIKSLIRIAINTYGFSDLDDDLTKNITFSNGQTIEVKSVPVPAVASNAVPEKTVVKETAPEKKKKAHAPKPKAKKEPVAHKKDHETISKKHEDTISHDTSFKPKVASPEPTIRRFEKPDLNANIHTKEANESDDFSSWLGGDYSDSVKDEDKF